MPPLRSRPLPLPAPALASGRIETAPTRGSPGNRKHTAYRAPASARIDGVGGAQDTEGEPDRAQAELVPVVEARRPVQSLAAHERSMTAAEVLEDGLASRDLQPSVTAGDARRI